MPAYGHVLELCKNVAIARTTDLLHHHDGRLPQPWNSCMLVDFLLLHPTRNSAADEFAATSLSLIVAKASEGCENQGAASVKLL